MKSIKKPSINITKTLSQLLSEHNETMDAIMEERRNNHNKFMARQAKAWEEIKANNLVRDALTLGEK